MMSQSRRFNTLRNAGLGSAVVLLLFHGASPCASAAHRADPAGRSLQFAYRMRSGETYRYHVVGFFNGHIPPFAVAPDPAVHLKTDLVYDAVVGTQSAAGVKVKFSVSQAILTLMEKDPGPDGVSDPNSETVFPISLTDIQGALNVTAILRPDGSVAKVFGGKVGGSPPKINLGFDIRKLFLLIMPVVFPTHALSVGDQWTSDDGVLGHQPGKTVYTNRLATITPETQGLTVKVDQSAVANVEDRLDKAGKPTTNEADAVDSTVGVATLKGTLQYRMSSAGDGRSLANHRAGRLVSGLLTMTANMKRRQPNPVDPSIVSNSLMDIEARLTVKAEPVPRVRTASTRTEKKRMP